MSLKDCLERSAAEPRPCYGKEPDAGKGIGDGELASLRRRLISSLGTDRIAKLSSLGRNRANLELSAAIELELSGGEYAGLSDARKARLVELSVAYITGLGPLQGLMDDPSVTEIMVNGTDSVFVERNGRLEPADFKIGERDQLDTIMERIVAPVGRRVDEQSPMVTAHLPGGHRANIVVEPIGYGGPYITIRKFRSKMFTLEELVGLGSLEADAARLLSWAVRSRKNIAVCGGTGGGKTTLLNALSVEISHAERIITIEDSAELRFDTHPHVARLEARGRNTEGVGEVCIRDLVINALRMRPDRIIVGECRGAETLDMLQAMTTGHDGSMTTLHASSPAEALSRLVMMSRFGIDLPVDVIEEQIASAIDVIVQQDRMQDGMRRVTAISALRREGRKPLLVPLVSYSRKTRSYEYHKDLGFLNGLVSSQAASQEEIDGWGL